MRLPRMPLPIIQTEDTIKPCPRSEGSLGCRLRFAFSLLLYFISLTHTFRIDLLFRLRYF
jgi:hypothetical protein